MAQGLSSSSTLSAALLAEAPLCIALLQWLCLIDEHVLV